MAKRGPEVPEVAVDFAMERVCSLLASPSAEVLDRTAVLLEGAVERLRSGRTDIEELRRARVPTRRAAALLEKACRYHSGWNTYWGARVGGYRAGGAAAEVIRPSRFAVDG